MPDRRLHLASDVELDLDLLTLVICDVVLLLTLATCTRDCQCLIVVLNGLIDPNNGFWHRF